MRAGICLVQKGMPKRSTRINIFREHYFGILTNTATRTRLFRICYLIRIIGLGCLSGVVALVAIFISLRVLPLATVTALTYAAPLFTTVLSIFMLGEKVKLIRWTACLVGFLGVLIICFNGGNFSAINPYMFLPLVFCIGMSYVAVLIKKLSKSEPVYLIAGYFSITIGIVGLFLPGED